MALAELESPRESRDGILAQTEDHLEVGHPHVSPGDHRLVTRRLGRRQRLPRDSQRAGAPVHRSLHLLAVEQGERGPARVAAGIAERLLDEPELLRRACVVVLDELSEQQREVAPNRAPRDLGDRGLHEGPRSLGLARRLEAGRRLDDQLGPAQPRELILRRGQPIERLEEQLRGRCRSAAIPRDPGRFRESRRDSGISSGTREREMTRGGFRIRGNCGDAAVPAPALAGIERVVRGSGEQRVRELDGPVRVAAHAHDRRLHRRGEGRVDISLRAAGRGRDGHHRGLGQGRRDEQHLPRFARQSLQSLGEQVPEFAAERERFATGGGRLDRPVSLDGPRELERVERVPARGLVDALHRPPARRDGRPRPDDPLDRAEAERANLHVGGGPLEGLLGAEAGRCPRGGRGRGGEPPRSEDRHGRRPEPPKDELDDLRGRCIDPLRVVDGDHHRLLARERADRVQRTRRDRPLIWRRTPVILEQQRHLERPALGRWQCREDRFEDRLEEVGQRPVRQLDLGAGRPAGEDAVARDLRGLDAGSPQRRLADAGLALEHEAGGQLVAPAKEREDPVELPLPPDEHPVRAGLACHPTIITPKACGSPHFLRGAGSTILDPMAIYVVETFLSRERTADLDPMTARLREAFPLQHMASYFIPDEETILHVVEAVSPDAVREALGRVGITADRIALADTVEPSRARSEGASLPEGVEGRSRR